MTKTYPIDFVRSFPGVTEPDIEFGRDHGLIEEAKPPKLSHLCPVNRLASEVWTTHHQIWRNIALKWALVNFSENDRDLFDEIDTIYADFNYPEDMKNIVSYMPGDDYSSPSTLRQRIFIFYERQIHEACQTRKNIQNRSD
jgi:hypothetical protein